MRATTNRREGRLVALVSVVGLCAACVLAVPLKALTYSAGPPNGKTGAPAEGTCHDCHDSFPLNSGAGSVVLTAPSTFLANQTYQITVTVTQSGQSRWGFEFTPLSTGTCTVTDPVNTQQDTFQTRVYVKHTSQGTQNGTPGPTSWSFDWTAPADPPDTVHFYAAGNAANGNDRSSGDYIYTTSHTAVLFVDNQPPNAINDLDILAAGADIVLDWSDPGDNVGVVEYRVYRSQQAYFAPTGIPTAVVAAPTTTWTDTGAAGDPVVNFFYNVTAGDAAQNEGGPSNFVGEFDLSTAQ
jgi:hypothetical protein